MNCCQFISIENIFKYTPLDHTDHIDAREHLFSDVKKFKLDVLFGNDCSDDFCNALKSGTITGKWLAAYENEDFQRGVANWMYYYYLIDYGQDKYPDSSSSDIKNKRETASRKAQLSLKDFKKWAIMSEHNFECWTVPQSDSCNDSQTPRTYWTSYDIV